MRRTSALLSLTCLVLLAFVGTHSRAQSTGRDLVVEALEKEHGGPIYRNSWALLVGINRYAAGGPLRRLNFGVADAQSMRDLLVKHYGFPESNVTLLLDGQATRQAILDALTDLGEKSGPEDRVIVYFSGHGHTVDLPREGKRGYLVPVDARLTDADLKTPARVERQCVPMTEVREKARLMQARHVLFLIDCCYSGLAVSGRSAGDVPYHLQQVAFRPMLGIIAAGSAGEQALENPEIGHGAFTKKLLDALTPVAHTLLADTEPPGQPDGVVTLKELAAFLTTAVPQITAGKQNPIEAQEDEGQILFFPVDGAPVPTGQSPHPEPPPDPGMSRPGRAWTNPTDGSEFLYVPAGPFQMGSNTGDDDEKPIHTVNLPAYWIGKQEVTNEQYARFLNANEGQTRNTQGQALVDTQPLPVNGATMLLQIEQAGGQWRPKAGMERHPMVMVTWYGAAAYARWAGCRLPTEAEWEKAARGTAGSAYPWGNVWDAAKCNSSDGGPRRTTPVGSYAAGASPFGCLDMAGNVWEWCSSVYKPYPYNPDDGREDPRAGGVRVLRGGSWYDTRDKAGTAGRFRCDPDVRGGNLGFRLARSSE